MKTKKILLVIFICISFSIPIGIYSYHKLSFLNAQEISMDIEVSNKSIGFNVDNDIIHFGRVPTGGIGKREVYLINNYTFPIKANIQAEGRLGKWIVVSKNDFVIEPDVREMVLFSARVPITVEYGNYTGAAKIVFTRKFFWE